VTEARARVTGDAFDESGVAPASREWLHEDNDDGEDRRDSGRDPLHYVHGIRASSA
jgi:hypothetical protein